MPVFKDSEAKVFELAPEGDYVLRVVEFECGLSKGAKTAGRDSYEVKFAIEGRNSHVKDNFIDHETCLWKLDLFLKSCGVQIRKNEAYEFRQDLAARMGIRWVDPIGLRCWARVKIEPSQKDPPKKYNKVAVFYTDKPKLPRHVEVDPMLADSPEPETTTQAQGDDVPW